MQDVVAVRYRMGRYEVRLHSDRANARHSYKYCVGLGLSSCMG